MSHSCRSSVPLCAIALTCLAVPAHAGWVSRQIDLSRQTATVRVDAPTDAPVRAVVVVTSTSDGWRGIAVALSDRLVVDGYAVVGLDAHSYLLEATRRGGGLAPSEVASDYRAVLQAAHQWFPAAEDLFLLGIADGGGLSLMAAADPTVGARLTGLVAAGIPSGVPLSAAYWNWTSWVTHRDLDEPTANSADYVAAVAPTPLSLIHAFEDPAMPLDAVEALFASGGEPRRLDLIASERPMFGDASEQFFNTVHGCLHWSMRFSHHHAAASSAAARSHRAPGRSSR